MKEHYLQLACGQTFLVEDGEGKETIMFLHGSGPGANAVSNWRFALPFFANNYRCLAPDLLGFGHSNAPKEITGVKAWLPFWLRQCIEILDYFGLDKVHLVGNSMGGGIALHLLAQHPERFSRGVLMGSVGVPFIATDALARGWGFYQQCSEDELAWLIRQFVSNPDILGADIGSIARERMALVMQEKIKEAFTRMFAGAAQNHVDALALPEEKIKTIPHTTLITHGREDVFIPLDNAYVLEHLLPVAQAHVFRSVATGSKLKDGMPSSSFASYFCRQPGLKVRDE